MRVVITVAARHKDGEVREYQRFEIPTEDLGNVAYVEVDSDTRHAITGAIGGAAESLIETQTVEVEPTHPDEACAICERETPSKACRCSGLSHGQSASRSSARFSAGLSDAGSR